MKVMLEEMERHFGKRPIIYTSVDFYQAILADGAFADYPIWVRSTKHHPAVPYGSRPWRFWRYQADGAIPASRATSTATSTTARANNGRRSSTGRSSAASGNPNSDSSREHPCPALRPRLSAFGRGESGVKKGSQGAVAVGARGPGGTL